MKRVCLRYKYEDEIRKGRWNSLVEQLADKLKNLLSDWTLEVCCFGSELALSDFLTKHKECKFFRVWYSILKLDSWEEAIKRNNKNLPSELWLKMTEKQKIDALTINLMDILAREGECKYFRNKETIEKLENLPKEIKRVYEGHYEGWLYLEKPLK